MITAPGNGKLWYSNLRKGIQSTIKSIMRSSTRPSDATTDNLRVQIRTQVRYCEDIPAVPSSVKTILVLLDDINSSLDDLEKAIVSDPSCVARLIQVANSTFYGSAQLVMSVRRAMLLLGFDALQALFANMPVYECFVQKNTAEIQMINSLRLHSLAVARLSQRIAADVRAIEPEVAFCAGFLHDIGQVVLLHLFPEDYYQLLSGGENDPEFDLLKAETEIFAVTHAEVGRWFAEAWYLPVPICQTIAMHHHLRAENRLVMIVKLADFIVDKERIGLVEGHTRGSSTGPLLRGLNLSAEHLKRYGRYIQSEVNALQRSANHAA
ncbi:MAG: HDOD domain-containing protein [bacterium]|nr:HDOD domain-containing protein [bacterium]